MINLLKNKFSQLLFNIYLSKIYSEKLNMMLKYDQLFQIDDLQSQLPLIASNFKHYFYVFEDKILSPRCIGILYTKYNYRAIINKSSFNQLIRLLKPIHKKEYNLLWHTNYRQYIQQQ
ncbi:unnamed protein product [Paramecium octaurelia]|uniref:Uncharacterized protein n=1 Tax=Paramecium octaurelia TaxID=43137 RepID=A0A8S1U4N8_PAROT|nr:unnamed protein product [Paramecium octaurelia]